MTAKTVLRDLAFVGVIAGGVVFLLARTAHEAPYAKIEIVPDSLSQHLVEESGVQWGLFYSVRSVKPKACDEVKVERTVFRVGEALPVAANSYVGAQILPLSAAPIVVTGLHVQLSQPLEPGDYLFALKATCYLRSTDVGMEMLVPPAEAHICFRVPDVSNVPYLSQRIQPITEDCRRPEAATRAGVSMAPIKTVASRAALVQMLPASER